MHQCGNMKCLGTCRSGRPTPEGSDSGGCADDAHRRFPRLSRVSRPPCKLVRLMIQFGFCSRAKHSNGLTTSTRTLKLSASCTVVLSPRVQYTVLTQGTSLVDIQSRCLLISLLLQKTRRYLYKCCCILPALQVTASMMR